MTRREADPPVSALPYLHSQGDPDSGLDLSASDHKATVHPLERLVSRVRVHQGSHTAWRLQIQYYSGYLGTTVRDLPCLPNPRNSSEEGGGKGREGGKKGGREHPGPRPSPFWS